MDAEDVVYPHDEIPLSLKEEGPPDTRSSVGGLMKTFRRV